MSLSEKEAKQFVERLPHWHGKMTREGAEMLLSGKAPGTYLLRKDPDGFDDQILLENAEANFVFVIAVAEKGRVVEHFLFNTERGWIWPKDEPRFENCHAYQSLETLIESIVSIPKHRVA